MSSRLEIVFLGSKPIGYHCLKFLIYNQQSLGFNIKGVITKQRKEFGTEHDLLGLAKENNISVFKQLDKLPECDIIYSVQHHEILKDIHIKKARKIALNLHLAPLPEYRGCNQFSFAILDQAKEFGVSIHEIDDKIDHGSILFEKRFDVPDNCWVNELYDLTVNEGINLFKESLHKVIQGNFVKKPQLTNINSNLHYRHEINKLKEIDLDQSAEKIALQIKATMMPGFSPPYFKIGENKVYLSLKEKE